MSSLHRYTNPSPQEYVTKDHSLIRELLHPDVFSGLGASLAEATVEPGCATAPHFHTRSDEMYYGLEGTGVLYIDKQPFAFGPQSYYLIPKNAVHYLKAETRMRVLCFCCPGYTHEHTVLVGKPE